MDEQPILSEDNLARVRSLLSAMESGDEVASAQLIHELACSCNDDLFQGVGKLARSMHNSVTELHSSQAFGMIDEQEFPDARERLNHVIKLTEDSAHTTLGAVEAGLPMVQETAEQAAQLLERWSRFRARELALDDFRQLSDDIEQFLSLSHDNAKTLGDGLSEVLMAQGYQDLTGQMIRRVITLVDEVETGLVQLVARVGGTERRVASGVEAEGPQLPGTTEGVVNGQDDVDDLLASLGF
jgi:chemotaxis protein CheZ